MTSQLWQRSACVLGGILLAAGPIFAVDRIHPGAELGVAFLPLLGSGLIAVGCFAPFGFRRADPAEMQDQRTGTSWVKPAVTESIASDDQGSCVITSANFAAARRARSLAVASQAQPFPVTSQSADTPVTAANR